MEIMMYLLVILVTALVVWGGIYLFRKYNITDKEAQFGIMLLELINHITGKFEYKYKKGVTDVMSIVIMSLRLVVESNQVHRDNPDSYFILKDLVFEHSKELCLKYDMTFDDGLEDILDEAVTFAIELYYK